MLLYYRVYHIIHYAVLLTVKINKTTMKSPKRWLVSWLMKSAGADLATQIRSWSCHQRSYV